MENRVNSNYERLKSALLDENDGFLIRLRFGAGFDNNKFTEILNILSDIQLEYSDSEVLPKSICGLFFDFALAVDGCLSLYSVEQQQLITDAADKIQDSIRNILY